MRSYYTGAILALCASFGDAAYGSSKASATFNNQRRLLFDTDGRQLDNVAAEITRKSLDHLD